MHQDADRPTGFIRPTKTPTENPLLQIPELYEAALDEFARKSFEEASLNDIIRAAGLNKGRFYYRFKDKMDLYLCLVDKISLDKVAYFADRSLRVDFPPNFFDQISLLTRAGLEYALHEPRYLAMWRRHLAETSQVKQHVKQAFPDRGKDTLASLVEAARRSGQFRDGFSAGFVQTVVEMILKNIDDLILPDMSEPDVLLQIDKLVSLLKHGMASSE